MIWQHLMKWFNQVSDWKTIFIINFLQHNEHRYNPILFYKWSLFFIVMITSRIAEYSDIFVQILSSVIINSRPQMKWVCLDRGWFPQYLIELQNYTIFILQRKPNQNQTSAFIWVIFLIVIKTFISLIKHWLPFLHSTNVNYDLEMSSGK